MVLSAQARVTTKQFQFRNFSVSLKACGRSPSNSHSAHALLRRVRAPRVTAPGSGQSPKSDGGTHLSHAVPMLSLASCRLCDSGPLSGPGVLPRPSTGEDSPGGTIAFLHRSLQPRMISARLPGIRDAEKPEGLSCHCHRRWTGAAGRCSGMQWTRCAGVGRRLVQVRNPLVTLGLLDPAPSPFDKVPRQLHIDTVAMPREPLP